MLPAYAASKGGVVQVTRSLARHDDGIEVRVLIFQGVREIAQNAAAAVGEVVAADAAVVDSVATTAMRMSFEQAQLGASRCHSNNRRTPAAISATHLKALHGPTPGHSVLVSY